MTEFSNLLIISSRYPHSDDTFSAVFVYSQVEELKKHFDRVVVISTTPYTPAVVSKLVSKKRQKDAGAKDYTYDNVEVYYTKNVYLPKDILLKNRGKQAARSAQKILAGIGFRPDLIHAHFLWPSGAAGVSVKTPDIPLVLTGHGYDVYDLPFRSAVMKKEIMRVLGGADRVITVSTKNREIMEKELDVAKDKIRIIPNGFDPALFKPRGREEARKALKLGQKHKIVLSVGNLKKVKGHINLIKSAKLVKPDDGQIHYYIVGEGPERPGLEQEIEKGRLAECVHLVGSKPHDEIPTWLAACDIFVLPSRFEGAPTVMFETLGCGRPVIGTDVGGIPDIINDPGVGAVVPADNPEALAEQIKRALSKQWDEKYIEEFAGKYTWNNLSRKIIKLYRELLEQ